MSFNIEHGLFIREQMKNPYPYIYTFRNEYNRSTGLYLYEFLKKCYNDPSEYRFEGYEDTYGNYSQDVVELWCKTEIDLDFEMKRCLIDKGIRKMVEVKKPLVHFIRTDE